MGGNALHPFLLGCNPNFFPSKIHLPLHDIILHSEVLNESKIRQKKPTKVNKIPVKLIKLKNYSL